MSDIDGEIAEIETVMRTDNRQYRGDPVMQSRYTELLTAKEAGGSAPQRASAAATEIAGIEKRMKVDFRGYMADQPMQSRYTELLVQKEEAGRRPPPRASGAMQGVGAEMAEIQAVMKNDYRAYRKDTKMQARYLELLEAQDAGSAPASASRPTSGIDAELDTIQDRMKTDFAGYMGDKSMRARYQQLLEIKEGVADPSGAVLQFETVAPAKVLDQYFEDGYDRTINTLSHRGSRDSETNIAALQHAAQDVVRDIGDQDHANNFVESFDRLPDTAQSGIFDALLTNSRPDRAATPDELETFIQEDDAGAALVEEWGENAAYRLAVVKARTAAIMAGLSDREKREVDHFIESAPVAEWTAMLRQLGDPDAVHRRPAFKEMRA